MQEGQGQCDAKKEDTYGFKSETGISSRASQFSYRAPFVVSNSPRKKTGRQIRNASLNVAR